jgi:hypothetical protein
VFHYSELLSNTNFQVSDNNAKCDAPEHVKFTTQPEIEDLNEAQEEQTSEMEVVLAVRTAPTMKKGLLELRCLAVWQELPKFGGTCYLRR